MTPGVRPGRPRRQPRRNGGRGVETPAAEAEQEEQQTQHQPAECDRATDDEHQIGVSSRVLADCDAKSDSSDSTFRRYVPASSILHRSHAGAFVSSDVVLGGDATLQVDLVTVAVDERHRDLGKLRRRMAVRVRRLPRSRHRVRRACLSSRRRW